MGCMDSYYYGFEADNDREGTRRFGYLNNDYPGCGACPDCCYDLNYDRDKINQAAAISQKWQQENPHTYLCKWEVEGFYGSFQFRAASLDKAREIAKSSLYDWESLLVQVIR